MSKSRVLHVRRGKFWFEIDVRRKIVIAKIMEKCLGKSVSGKAICCEADKFKLDYGINLAISRCLKTYKGLVLEQMAKDKNRLEKSVKETLDSIENRYQKKLKKETSEEK
jgi:hypothetical protein